MRRKDIQRARMYRYFLDAAAEIIEEEGIEKITIRKVAERAGYTSSTTYNYFKDLSHLKFFAAMRYTRYYIEDLPAYKRRGKNTLEKWLYMWECFCIHSFEYPKIYSVIYIDDLSFSPQKFNDYYYDIYEKELIQLPDDIKDIVIKSDFAIRSVLYIKQAVEEGFLEEASIDYLADVTQMIWKGMLITYLNNRREFSKEEAIRDTLSHIYHTIINVVHPEKRHEINYTWDKDFRLN